jgi:hypothetical protein
MKRLINTNVGFVVLLMIVAGAMTGCVSYQPSPGNYKSKAEAVAVVDSFMKNNGQAFENLGYGASERAFSHVRTGQQQIDRGYDSSLKQHTMTTKYNYFACQHHYNKPISVNINLFGLITIGIMDPTMFSLIKADDCYISSGGPFIWKVIPFYLFMPSCVDVVKTARAMQYIRSNP